MTSRTSSSQARLVGIFVLVLIISLAEFAALLLDYQNNRYLRQYVSDNLGTIILAAIGLLFVAGGAGYIVSKRLGIPKSPGPRVPTFAKIGSFVGRRYKLIIVFWILLFAASFPLSRQLSQVTTSNTSGGHSGTSQSALAQNFIGPNKNAMISLVTFSQAPGSFGSADTDPILKNVVTMRSIISQLKASDSEPLQTYVTGDLATTADSSLGSAADLGRIEPVTIGAILVLAGLFFLAIVTPFVPLATVGMALLMAEGGLYLIGKYVIPIQNTTTTFLLTIMLGVGTDYSIFLMARYREERVEGRDKAQAIQTSIIWSGESIATSATTVIIAFGAMTLTSFTLLRSIGVGLGFGVLIALLVSLTLIPSLILIAGDRIFWPTSGMR